MRPGGQRDGPGQTLGALQARRGSRVCKRATPPGGTEGEDRGGSIQGAGTGEEYKGLGPPCA